MTEHLTPTDATTETDVINGFLKDTGIQKEFVEKVRSMMRGMDKNDLQALFAEKDAIRNADNPASIAINRIRFIEHASGRTLKTSQREDPSSSSAPSKSLASSKPSAPSRSSQLPRDQKKLRRLLALLQQTPYPS